MQKSVRDRAEGIPVSMLYLGLSWLAMGLGVVMLVAGLWNAGMTLSEKGFFGLAFGMTLFAAVAVQKNVRDALAARTTPPAYAVPQEPYYPQTHV